MESTELTTDIEDEIPAEIPPVEYAQVNRIDIAKAFRLRFEKHNTFQEIADVFQVTKGAVFKALKPFRDILGSGGALKAYKENKLDILSIVEMTMLTDIVDAEKRKKATIGNAAYAAKQVHEMKRLEQGRSTANVEVLHAAAVKHADILDKTTDALCQSVLEASMEEDDEDDD